MQIQGLCRSGGGLKTKLKVKEHCALISDALNKLHACTDHAVFMQGVSLFLRFIENDLQEPNFATHFDAEYGPRNGINWSQATSSITIPTTNNGVERFNRTFKSTGTSLGWSLGSARVPVIGGGLIV